MGYLGSNKYQIYPGDYDGNGFVDLGYYSFSNNTFRVARSDGTKFGAPEVWLSGTPFTKGQGAFYVGDFDGNGADDILYFDPTDKGLYVTLAKRRDTDGGTGFGRTGSGKWSPSGWFGDQRRMYYPGDFTGDKKTDLGYFEPRDNTFHVLKSTASGFSYSGAPWVGPTNSLGDVTGTHYVGNFDGIKGDDLGYFNTNEKKFYVMVSNQSGTGFTYAGAWLTPDTSNWSVPNRKAVKKDHFFIGDFNGDGADDLGYFDEFDSSFHVSLAKYKINGQSGFGASGSGRWIERDMFGDQRGQFYVSRPGRRTLMGDPLVVNADPMRDPGVIPPLVVPAMIIETDDSKDPDDDDLTIKNCPSGERRIVRGNVKIVEDHNGEEDEGGALAGYLSLSMLNSRPATLDSRMEIKVRGHSSQGYPKKSYSLELQPSTQPSDILGMPYVDDWVLHSCYADMSCMRNFLTYSVARDMMPYAPRARFVELFINSKYQGLYVLVEKIKRSENRVNIPRPAPSSSAGNITGGYIFNIDIKGGWTWQSDSKIRQPDWFIGGGPKTDPFKWAVDYPKPPDCKQNLNTDADFVGGDLTKDQKQYLQSYLDQFENYLMNRSSPTDPPNTQDPPDPLYRKMINGASWVDFTLIQEFALNGDGYYKSMYMVKKRDDEPCAFPRRCPVRVDGAGLLHMGPVWDFDIAYNWHGPVMDISTGVQKVDPCTHKGLLYSWSPSWIYRKLWMDPWFKGEAGYRWRYFRDARSPTQALKMGVIKDKIDAWAHFIADAKRRDERRWPVGPRGECNRGGVFKAPRANFIEELKHLRGFIEAHVPWLDGEIGGPALSDSDFPEPRNYRRLPGT